MHALKKSYKHVTEIDSVTAQTATKRPKKHLTTHWNQKPRVAREKKIMK